MTAWIKTVEHARMMNVLEKRIAELEKSLHGSSLELISRSKRIAELEAENEQCKEAFAAVSEGKPMGSIVEKHLIQNMQKRIAELESYQDEASKVFDKNIDTMLAQNERIAELEAERDQLGEWTERGNTHVGELVAENERLREMNDHLANSDSVACLQDAERIAELGGALGEMTTRRNLAENEVRQLQAENERLRLALKRMNERLRKDAAMEGK